MSTTDTSTDDVPFYLMPVAAVLGMLAAFAFMRLFYLVYTQILFKKPNASPYAPIVPRSVYGILIGVIIVSTLGYAKVVASVNNAMEASSHALFDPYEILDISTNANATVIKQAYRSLSKVHHPDKGGSPTIFQSINLAYQALTDKVGMLNYQQYGHPEGPPSSSNMAFALPDWLLHPEGNVVFVLLGLYLGMFVLIIYAAMRMLKKSETKSNAAQTGAVTLQDSLYLASNLSPTTSHIDILYMIATTPDNIAISEKTLLKIEEIKQERRAKESKASKSGGGNNEFELDDDDGGWADDEEDDEDAKKAIQKAKQLEEEEKKERLSLKKAQGTDTILLEGIDEGVIGQAWVESTLIRQGKWPPQELGILEDKQFNYKGNQVGAMEHAAVRRNLCMTHGRLHATILNSETQLLEAGSKGLIDRTYFSATAEFRKRTGALLESALRMAIVLRSYRLTKTIIETICMFQIGTPSPLDPSTIAWFESVMKRQYGCVPRLDIIGEPKVYTDDEEEIATNDTCTLEIEMDRTHAENFVKQKVAVCKKQGIPPQVALQAYHEGWWVTLRAEKLDGNKDSAKLKYEPVNEQMKKLLSAVDVETFAAEEQENRLVNAFPVMVKNCAQVKMKLKLQFKAPAIPGKYRFYIDIKSQEFLGADQVLTCEQTIVDESSVKKESEEEPQDEAEAKKDK